MTSLHRIPVDLGERSYEVLVGHGAISSLKDSIPGGVKRVAVVTQAAVPIAARVVDVLTGSELTVARVEIGSGESDKSLETVIELCDRFSDLGLTRQDLVIGVGGGLVTDVAGFAASVWHRGTRVVHVATTLLAMVDAAIGGKTGVNIRSGKNLVGSFWQPSAVICDLDSLETLPIREQRCGLGEISKYHFLTGDDLLGLDLSERIARCVQIKAEIVASDEREGGRRALLNYGHTLGHALETVGGHVLAHGEAVAIGLIFAARLACDLGRIDEARVAYHHQVVEEAYGLRTRPPKGMDAQALVEAMGRDKKAMNGLTFVLDSAAGLEVVEGIDPNRVRSTLDSFLGE